MRLGLIWAQSTLGIIGRDGGQAPGLVEQRMGIAPKAPESPYGESKLIGEWILSDVAAARRLTDGPPLRHTSLRYFNVVGSGYPDLFDTSPHNLFPVVLKALTEGRTPQVNGTD